MINCKPLFSALCLSLLLAGCGAGDGSATNPDVVAQDEFDTSAMVQNLTDNVVLPTYDDVLASSTKLVTDLSSYCLAIDSDTEAEAISTAQSSWRETLDHVQISDAFLFGAIADDTNALRNTLYSFGAQTTSTCGIDQAVVLNQTDSFDISSRPNASTGLDAIEYLLFNENLDHSCPSLVTETSNWNALTDDERKRRRCDYAVAVATQNVTAAEALVNAWSPNGDNFRSLFINPSNVESSLTNISDALFFIDTEVQDLRLGRAIGRDKCTPVDCSTRFITESSYSATSYANVKANLMGFEQIIFGAGGTSFDDLIASVGQSQLNNDFQRHIQGAISLIDAQTESLQAAADTITTEQQRAECEMAIAAPDTDSNYPLCQIYGHVKALSDLMKSEFILATALEIPESSQSDND